MAQLVVRRIRDPKTRGSNPVRSTRNNCESLYRVKHVVLTRCPCVSNPCVYIRTHKNDRVRTLKILESTSEFGGLRKHEKTRHAPVGRTELNAALAAAAVAIHREGGPIFSKRIRPEKKGWFRVT